MSSSDGSAAGGEPGQQEVWEDWEDNESSGFKSLFSDARFSSLDEVLQHDHNLTGFSLKSYRAQVRQAMQSAMQWHLPSTGAAKSYFSCLLSTMPL